VDVDKFGGRCDQLSIVAGQVILFSFDFFKKELLQSPFQVFGQQLANLGEDVSYFKFFCAPNGLDGMYVKRAFQMLSSSERNNGVLNSLQVLRSLCLQQRWHALFLNIWYVHILDKIQ
jgi:hypothetical protein